MPSFADIYNNAPAPSVHSTRHPSKSSHPTSSSHIPPDAKPIDFRRMSSSKAGMGRTRGTERSSKPEEAPIGPEFAERTQIESTSGVSDGSNSPPVVGSSSSPTAARKILGAFEKRRGSSGSPRNSTTDEPTDITANSADKTISPSEEPRSERRGSITHFLKKVF
jgi:hypothetical protein